MYTSEVSSSIIFLAVTGEERGLLGSDYFAHNPTVPIENIVANLNLDMFLGFLRKCFCWCIYYDFRL